MDLEEYDRFMYELDDLRLKKKYVAMDLTPERRALIWEFSDKDQKRLDWLEEYRKKFLT